MFTRIYFGLLSIIILISLTGCDLGPRVQAYGIEITVEGSGAVVKTPDDTTYQEGTTVDLLAEPETNWVFISWTEDADGTENPITVTMDTRKYITATFEPDYSVATLTDTTGETTPGFIDVESVVIEQTSATTISAVFIVEDQIPALPDAAYGDVFYKIWFDGDPSVFTSHRGGTPEYVVVFGYHSDLSFPDRAWGGYYFDCINSTGGHHPFSVGIEGNTISVEINLEYIGSPDTVNFSYESFSDGGYDGDSNAAMATFDILSF